MKINLRVTYDDGGDPVVVSATTRDVLAWEERFSRNWVRLLEDTTLTDKCFLAWSALAPGIPFDEWVGSVDFVVITEAEEPRPLAQTPSTGA
jgi:hypothetical protein